MAGLREVIEQQGVFCALYSDRATISSSRLRLTNRWTILVEPSSRALRQLGIQMIPAYSPRLEGAVKEALAPGKGGCLRNCDCESSPPRPQLIGFCERNM